MNTNEYIEAYGTVTASLIIKKVADNIPEGEEKQILIELAISLEQALTSYVEKALGV